MILIQNTRCWMIVALSCIVTLVIFLAGVLPDMLEMGFSKHECVVMESTMIQMYCCTSVCQACDESYPGASTCKFSIAKTHQEKNITRCVNGETDFCADEGSQCDNGPHCCQWGQVLPGYPEYGDVCYRQLQNWACRLHCPTCYKARIVYTYGNTTTVTRLYEDDKDKIEKILNSLPVGTKKDCWINPEDSQDVSFHHGIRVVIVFMMMLAFLPAIVYPLALLIYWIVETKVLGLYQWRDEEQRAPILASRRAIPIYSS